VKLGLFMMPVHPPEKPRTQCFEEDIELILRAEELGFAEAWIGQHHTLAWEPIPSNDVFIANVFPRTRTIRLGTGVSIIPQHHPVNVALRLALLDHLSHGRLNCGFGQGGVPTDHELFGLPDSKTQGLMTLEGIDMILRLWQAQAPFEFKGQFWTVKIDHPNPELGMGELLRPYQKPHPPIAMSVIKADSMAARLAGVRGYLPLSTNLVPASTVTEHWKIYCSGAQEAGRTKPNRSVWRVARSIYVGETNEEARQHALNGTFARSFEYMCTLMKSANMLHLVKHDLQVGDEDVTPEYILKHLCIVGDSEACIRQLRQLWEQTGGFGTLLMIAHDWDDKAKWLRSLERLAQEVVPALPTTYDTSNSQASC
jgi:alkanesulfonate monooxygenase SsuD/methylene tetrahydromethanopterin reductase-like flavin-dependent oxidoreductase (luciferase family)